MLHVRSHRASDSAPGGRKLQHDEKVEDVSARPGLRRARPGRGRARPGAVGGSRGGKGDGVAAAALSPKPADWTSKKIQAESDGELFWKISHGRGAMPSCKQLPENDRWALVHYIHSLGGK